MKTIKIEGYKVTVKPNADSNTRRIHIYEAGEKMPFLGTSSTMNDEEIETYVRRCIKEREQQKAKVCVFNYTDNVYASPDTFRSQKEARKFIKYFRARFTKQGYYRNNRLEKIDPKHIDLEIIPANFHPFRKQA